jgi:hypothetical protein
VAAPRNRRNNGKLPPKKSAQFVFWTLFLIVIICLFFVNWQLIRSSLENTGVLDRLFNKTETGKTESPGSGTLPEIPQDPGPGPDIPGSPSPGELGPVPPIAEDPAPALESADPASPAVDSQPDPAPLALPETNSPVTPAQLPAETPGLSSGAVRDRALYFIRVDNDGTIIRTRVARSMAASDSPLEDSLRTLLQGPTAEEQRRGLITLIPAGVKFLRAEVRGSTAYINLSEEFQFNTYGVEGYIGQLRQIVWTATEFPNIRDVQILIEGRRIDYLGEGINIGSPLGRDSF